MVGYSGMNANRDFEMMKQMRSRIPAKNQWYMIDMTLKKKKGTSIETLLLRKN